MILYMTARRRVTFWIDVWQDAALKAIKERDGVPEAEQLRRAVTAWVEEKGIDLPREVSRRRAQQKKGGR
jgi:hypothetical protein